MGVPERSHTYPSGSMFDFPHNLQHEVSFGGRRGGVLRVEMTEITWLTSHFLFGKWHERTCVLQSGLCGNLEFLYLSDRFDLKMIKYSVATKTTKLWMLSFFLFLRIQNIVYLSNMYRVTSITVTTTNDRIRNMSKYLNLIKRS